MCATNNVSALFSMDLDRFIEYEAQLKPYEAEAEELRTLLNSRAGIPAAGKWPFVAGLLMVLGAVALPIVFSSYIDAELVLVASIGSVGIWLIADGIRKYLVGRDIRRRAEIAMRVLEGRNGFLWRFETLLMNWAEPPREIVRNSLRNVCQSSKDGNVDNDHFTLRAYWFWISALAGRMREFDQYVR